MRDRGLIPHGIMEDAIALLVGSALIATGLAILSAAGLTTGGMAGFALLVGHFVPWPPGVVFAVLNFPFLVLALRAMGTLFAIRTVIGSVTIAAFSTILGRTSSMHIDTPAVASVIAGSLLGMGTLAFVRHGAGVGGIGVLTVWLNRKRGWNIGKSQIFVDVFIMISSTFVLPLWSVLWSSSSAVTMGVVTGLWLRQGRYLAFSPLHSGKPRRITTKT